MLKPSPLTQALTLLLALPWSLAGFAERYQSASHSNLHSGPANVILIIGDGMDESQITMGRNYWQGADGYLLLDKMPYRSNVQILTLDETQSNKYLFVADSANSATAMATGRATSRGRIATTAGTDKDLTTIAELAKAAGMATGIVTTASVTDATPAAFISHINIRGCQNPERMLNSTSLDKTLKGCQADLRANGGAGSIAEQIATGDTDIILGGGRKHFAKHTEAALDGTTEADLPETIKQQAKANGYQVVHSMKQMRKAANAPKILGLFADSTLPVKLRGENDRRAEAPLRQRGHWLSWSSGSVTFPAPMACEPNPAFSDSPSLATMTQTALDHLERRSQGKGFFLMVESASMDKQAHRRNPCGQLGELQQLEDSVELALAFAKREPNTLILVTADHGQAAQIIPDRSFFSDKGSSFTPGKMALIKTRQGDLMAINYATNNYKVEDHTGTSVPLFSNQPVPAMLQQPEIFEIMRRHLGLPKPWRSY